jgi:hypothetical protein
VSYERWFFLLICSLIHSPPSHIAANSSICPQVIALHPGYRIIYSMWPPQSWLEGGDNEGAEAAVGGVVGCILTSGQWNSITGVLGICKYTFWSLKRSLTTMLCYFISIRVATIKNKTIFGKYAEKSEPSYPHWEWSMVQLL